jgi:eukaryotic-like serine/threonine-protein kinase
MSAAPGLAGEAGRGDWLGRHRVITRLGRGGMATVYLAVSLGPDDFSKLVVIKELLPELNGDPNFARMFPTEGRLAAQRQPPERGADVRRLAARGRSRF